MQKLNTTAVYILSIVGFLCCCFYGLGFLASIIALVIANKELKKYSNDPESYSNGKAMQNAKKLAIVAVIVSGLMALYSAYQYFAFTEEERIEQTMDMLESFGVPQEIIDQARADAEGQLDD